MTDNVICMKYTLIYVCQVLSSTHTQTCLFLMSQNLLHTVHFLHIFDIFHSRCTHTHTRQDQLVINCGRTVHNDFTCQAWSCCCVAAYSTAQWPPGVSSQALTNGQGWQWISRLGGLSDLSLHQQTLLQPLGLSTGCCALSVFFQLAHTVLYYSVSLFLFLLIACNFQPKSKTLQRHGSSKINNTAKRCQLLINVPRGGSLNMLHIHIHAFTFAAPRV